MQADESATHSQVAIGGQTVIHKLAHKPSTLQGNTKQPGTLICTNCGRRGHCAKDTICPALNQTCSLCGKLGHFKRVCRSGPTAKPAPKQRDKRTRVLQTKVNAVSSCPFLHTVHLLSGVTEATYRRHFAHLPLLPAATLRDFDNTVLSGGSLGRFLTQVKNKNRRVCAEFYVLPPRCSAVMARTSSQPLVCRSTGQQWRYAQSRTTPWILHKIIHVTCPTNWAPFLFTSTLSLTVCALSSSILMLQPSSRLPPPTWTDHLSLLNVKSANKRDSTLSTVLHFVSSGWPSKKLLAPDIQQFFAVRDGLQTEDQCLLRENRIVLPTALRQRLLAKAHEDHPGIVRMKRKLRQSYWWPGQDKDIENFVKHCAGCQLSDKSLAPANVSATSIPLLESPCQKVAIDVTGPFLIAPQSSKFLVVLIDYKSKFPEILMSSNVRSSTIIGWLDEVFSRFGTPDELVSDNGPQFTSMEFTNFLQKYNIHHTHTAVYNPQENGCVERFNQYLKHGIQAFHASGEAWASGIQALLHNYRATAATPQGRSPGEVMFHRPLRLPFQIPASAHRARPPSPQLATSASDAQGVHSRGPYCLSNGQRWNARKLRRYLEPEAPLLHHHETTAPPVRRSQRQNRGVLPARYPNEL
ncbi:Pol polyprotein [Plakobranchus ocellatus]|uniref:Pol polyprotein n=1 Tax=Plakobranchus ocellatus TaxID=259542 RepID=A0AAV4D1P5_9GAST|nr:Pol polyprotein [Plakobranchus ocellatus]